VIRALPGRFDGGGLAAMIFFNIPDNGVLLSQLPTILLAEDDINPRSLDHRLAYNFNKRVRAQVTALKRKGMIRTEPTYNVGNIKPLILIKRNYPVKKQA